MLKTLDRIVWFLIVVGGLNWGLFGLFNLDLVRNFFGDSWFGRIIYVLIGAAAVYSLITVKKNGGVNAQENK